LPVINKKRKRKIQTSLVCPRHSFYFVPEGRHIYSHLRTIEPNEPIYGRQKDDVAPLELGSVGWSDSINISPLRGYAASIHRKWLPTTSGRSEESVPQSACEALILTIWRYLKTRSDY